MKLIKGISGINQIGMHLVEKQNKSDDEELISKSFLKTRFVLILINVFLLFGSIAWIIYSLTDVKSYEQMLQGAIDGNDITYMLDGRVQRIPLNEVPIINGNFKEHQSLNVYFNDGKVIEIGNPSEQLLVTKRVIDIVKAYVILVIFSFGVIVKTIGKEWFAFLLACFDTANKEKT